MERVAKYFRNLFSCKSIKFGEIGFNIDISTPDEISFWIDARRVWVDWVDGNKSDEITTIGLFSHKYVSTGKFRVRVYGEGIADVDIRKCNITSLEVSKCPTLEFLDCSENALAMLDVTNCKQLYELYCGRNQLQELMLGKYDNLFYISCSCNNLEKIQLSGCRNLVNFRCRQNRLDSLDVSHCRKLASVNIEGNRFDFKGLKDFLSTLVIRPSNDIGFIVFHHNIGGDDDDSMVRSIVNKKGWREI